MSTCILYIRP